MTIRKNALENLDNLDDTEGAIRTVVSQIEDIFGGDPKMEKKPKEVINVEFRPNRTPNHEQIKYGKDTINRTGTRTKFYDDGTSDTLRNVSGRVATEKKKQGRNREQSTVTPINE